MDSSTEVAGLDWSAGRIIPAFQPPQRLHVYDISKLSPDEQLSVTTLAGLVNRPQPQVYLISNGDDVVWLNEALASVPHDTPAIDAKGVLDTLLTTYRSSIQGTIMYDPDFQDSINIATTIAGQRDGIVVSPAQAAILQQEPHQLPVLDDLRTYHWHTRLQAYHWAQQNLLANASKRFIAGLDPHIMNDLRSFLVATRTFVYWLDSRSYLPDPTLDWLSERTLMQELFKAFEPGTAVHLGWFIDEGSGVGLTSQAAMPVLATDFFSNLEVWTGIQPAPSSAGPQHVGATLAVAQPPAAPESKVYVSFTISDGDNLQYIEHRMFRLWRDPARGKIPIGWTISPVLQQAAPAMAAYYQNTATPNDELIAGPSGAGYMFPSRWPAEQLPAFLQSTGKLMQDMNLKLLQVLDTNPLESLGLSFISFVAGTALSNENLQQQFLQALAPIGLAGLLSGNGRIIPKCTFGSGNLPVYHNLGIASSVDIAVKMIEFASLIQRERPLCLNLYILAWNLGPSDLLAMSEKLGSEYEFVTPGKLLALAAQG